jgi:integrase
MRRATISRHHPLAGESAASLNSFDDLLLAFLYARADLKSASRDRTSLQHLYPAFTGRLLCELNPVMVRQYIRQRQADKASASSINKEIGLLSRAVNYARLEWGAALDNPVQGLKQREPEGRVRWLTKTQAAALVTCAGRLGSRAAHLPAVITLALNTGMRKGELLGLEWARVDFDHGLIYLDGADCKSSKRRAIPINAAARAALVLRQAVNSGPRVFGGLQDVKRSFAHACQLAGIVNFRFHDLRHTFASWLVQAGVPLTEVRDLLGHASIEMTERYAHLAPDRLRRAVQLLEAA